MVTQRDIKRSLANEKVEILFYAIKEKGGKRLLKPLGFTTHVSLGLVRAILDRTVILTFYDTLARNLSERGVASGSKIQLRAKFSSGHEMFDSQLKGTMVLCEVDI